MKELICPKGITEIYSRWTSRGASWTLLPLLRCYLGGEAKDVKTPNLSSVEYELVNVAPEDVQNSEDSHQGCV